MSLTVVHAKINSITDWTQADLDAQIALGNFPPGTLIGNITQPSDWNNNHTISGTVDNSQLPSGIDAAKIGDGSVSNAEYQYLGNVTSDIQTQLNAKQASGNYITALTGDVAASGPGSSAATLATVNSNVGSFGGASQVGAFTVNAKGLVTAASNTSIQIAESQVTNLVTDLAAKQGTITLTTTGTSGVATFIANTLNIPNYATGSGTVTSVSVVTANGVSGSVANSTTTPAITLTLGAITPTSVAASGAVSGSNLSGTNTGDQNLFSTFAVSGQSNVVADTTSDTVTFVAGTNMTITTDASTDTITFNATGGGSYNYGQAYSQSVFHTQGGYF